MTTSNYKTWQEAQWENKVTGSTLNKDPELETEAFNKLTAMLRRPENARKILEVVGFKEDGWTFKLSNLRPNQDMPEEMEDAVFQRIIRQSKGSISQEAKAKMTQLTTPEVPIKIQAQQPIVSYGGNWILGYVDIRYLVPVEMYAVITARPVEHPGLSKPFEATGEMLLMNSSWPELPVLQGGYKAVNVIVSSHTRYPDSLFRKVNTLISQIRPEALYCIFSADNSNRSEFEAQGIKLITPEDIGVSLKEKSF